MNKANPYKLSIERMEDILDTGPIIPRCYEVTYLKSSKKKLQKQSPHKDMMPTSLLLHLRYSSNELNKPLYNLNHCKYSFSVL